MSIASTKEKSKISVNLPRMLGAYSSSNFTTKLKVRFTYYLFIATILIMGAIILNSIFLQSNNPSFNSLHWPTIIIELILLTFYSSCLFFLIKGFFKIVAHVFLIGSFLFVWLIIWLDRGEPLGQLDTISYIFVLLACIPILISKQTKLILIYVTGNILVLTVFVISSNIDYYIISEYYMDNLLAMIIIGIIIYNVLKINVLSLDKSKRDIKERKKVEKALLTSESRYREMMELLPQPVFEANLDMQLTYVNKSGFNLFGYNQEDLNRGLLVSEIIDPKDHERAYANINKSLQKLEAPGNRYIAQKKDGTAFPLFIFSNAIEKGGMPIGIRGVAIDYSERENTQRELDEYRKNLEELVKVRTEDLANANKELIGKNEELENTMNNLHRAQEQLIESEKMASLGVMAAGIAHEINNPLNFIYGGYLGLSDYVEDNQQAKKDVSDLLYAIGTGVERASKIVSSLNHFSRNTEDINEPCDIHEIIDNCLTMLENQLKHKAEIGKNYSKNKLIVLGNDGKLHQAFVNILTNAVQSLGEHGAINIETKSDGENVNIIIIDEGSGIEPEVLSNVFDPFYTTKPPGVGSGLGLSITYNIIKEHNGNINIKSKLQEGTTVSITLPLK